jgi:hypothetical protein
VVLFLLKCIRNDMALPVLFYLESCNPKRVFRANTSDEIMLDVKICAGGCERPRKKKAKP